MRPGHADCCGPTAGRGAVRGGLARCAGWRSGRGPVRSARRWQQNTHAVPGAGGDLGRRGTGGQPQRQRRMTKVVRAQAPTTRAGRVPRRGAGLVPDPAVEAFAERATADTPEQPPICGAPMSLQVTEEETDKLGRDRDCPDGAFWAEFEAAQLAWRAVTGPGTRGPGKGHREGQLSPATRGKSAGIGPQRDGFGGARRGVVKAAEERGQLRADPGDLGQDRPHLGRAGG